MGSRAYLFVLGGLAALFGGLLLAQPQPLDWRPDYGHASARPLGGAVLHGLLPAWTGDSVETVEVPPYLRLADTAHAAAVYLFVTDTFEPDAAEAARLHRFAARGGTVFVAANTLAGPLADTLSGAERAPGFRTMPRFTRDPDSLLHLAAPALHRPAGYRFPLAVRQEYFVGMDAARTRVLGYDTDDEATLVRVRVGRGAFVLSSTPRAFSNAALTGPGDGAAYVAGVLAYLPAGRLLWDAHHKPGRRVASPLRVVFATPPLRWAYTLLLIGTLLFVGFRGRRWQRPIPVVAPPPNALLAFVRTVGRLYAQHGDTARLVARRQRYFFDRLRTRLGLSDPDLTPATEARVAGRCGLPPEEVAALFDRLRRLEGGAAAAGDLIALDRALGRFYDAIGR